MTMNAVPSIPQLPPFSQLTEAAYFTTITRYEHVAAYTLLVYDWILCFQHEQSLLATRGLFPGKLAYLFCRYWPIITHPITMWVQVQTTDRRLCERTFRIPLFLTIANFAGAASVLTVRAHAFTGAKRSVARLLICCFIVVSAYQVWAVATQLQLVPPPVPACFPVNRPNAAQPLSVYFLAPFLFDLVVTATLVWHAFSVKLRLSEPTDAVGVFVREGAAYFIAISTINLVSASVNFLPDVDHNGVMAAMNMLLPNILACRLYAITALSLLLIINLRSASSEEGTRGGMHDTSTSIRFANPRTDLRNTSNALDTEEAL